MIPPFEEIPGYLLRRALQVHNLLWAEHVPGDLTPQQLAVLLTLERHPEVDQRTVGEIASLDKSNVADVVERLERRKLLVRGRDPLDGRRRVLSLTAAGRRLLAKAAPDVLAVNEALTQRLTAAERRQLRALLAKVANPPTDA